MIKATFKSGTKLETGSYLAELKRIEELTTIHGDSWRWVFSVNHAEAADGEIEVSGITTTNFSDSSKAGRWAMIMLGARPDPEFDLEQLIGCEVELLVEKTVKPDGKTYSNVKEILKLIDNNNSFIGAKSDIPF